MSSEQRAIRGLRWDGMEPDSDPGAAAGVKRALAAVFGVFGRAQTWVNLVYLWLAFPLGLLYFVFLAVGLPLGIGLLIVWVGLVMLAVTLLVAWWAILLERWQADVLLGARLGPARRVLADRGGHEPVSGWVRSVGGSPALWKGLLFLGLKFPLGLAGWIVSLVGLSVGLGLLSLPWIAGHAIYLDDLRLGWEIDARWQLPFVSLAGFAILLATLHLQNLIAALWRALAVLLLSVAPRAAVAGGGATGSAPAEATPAADASGDAVGGAGVTGAAPATPAGSLSAVAAPPVRATNPAPASIRSRRPAPLPSA